VKNLFADYIAGAPELAPFYAQPIGSLFTAPLSARAWDERLVREINDYQQTLGNDVAIAGNELAIVTGQQPALFTGPLYTIYKAITAIRLADRVQRETGRPCVPIFWNGSDDHDFEEARNAHFLTKNHDLMTLRYEPAANVVGLPMFRVPIEASLHELADRAAANTVGSEFRADITQFLHDSLSAAESLSDWSVRLLARLFRGTNLVIFSPHLTAARTVAAPVLTKEIAAPLNITRLLNEAGDRLEALGYPRQITKADNECGFFLEVDGFRRKVQFIDGRYRLPEVELDYSVDEMLRIASDAPARVSANVAMRCIVQQHLFPTAAYVGGPGEVAYWAQFKPIFEHFDLPMPVVYPRAQCVLTTSKLTKLMNKFEFSLDDLLSAPDALLDRALAATTKNPALEALKRGRTPVEAALNALASELARYGAVAPMAEALARKTTAELDRLDTALLRGDSAQNDAVRKQLDRLCNALVPSRKPQERVYTVFSLVFEHGWDLVPRLMRALDVESFTMNEVEL